MTFHVPHSKEAPPTVVATAQLTAVTSEVVGRFLAKYDTSKDGYLDESELWAAFKDLGAYIPIWRAWRALNVSDTNRDGLISISELGCLLNYVKKRGYKFS